MSYTQKQIKALIEDDNSWKKIASIDSMGMMVKELDFMGNKYRKIYLWQKRFTPKEKMSKYGYYTDGQIYPYDTETGFYQYSIRKTRLCDILYELAKEENK